MKVLNEKTNLIDFDNQIIQKSNEGRWYHLDRVFIFKVVETGPEFAKINYKAVSLNLAERIVAFVSQIFNPNYFSSALKASKATSLNSNDFQSIMETEKVIKKMEKDYEELASCINNLDSMFEALIHPNTWKGMKNLIEATSFVEKHIQENAKGHSIELDIDTFSKHPQINNSMGTILHRLVISGKIYGYEISRGTIKVALDEQAEIIQLPTFVDRKRVCNMLFDTTAAIATLKW